MSTDILNFGTTNDVLNFDIENIGRSSFTYTVESNSYDWLSISPKSATIEAGRKKSVTITLDRTKIDEDKNITLPISSNAGSGNINIKVEHKTAAAKISLSKSELDFGDSNTTLNFDVENNGDAELNFEMTNNEDWITFSPSPLNVPANGQRIISATIDRSKITSAKDIDFAYASNAGSGLIKVKVGYIAPSAEIALSKSKLDFGENLTHLSFDVENDGNADLTYNISTGSEGWLSVSPASSTISGGGVKTVTVTVNRENLTSNKEYTLVVTSNAGSKEILIKVTKPIPAGVLDVSVTSLAFGENLDQLTFTVSNTGTAALNFKLLGNYPWLSGHPVNGVVEPSSSMTITIYVDRDKIFGDESGTLTVQTTDGQEHRIAVTVYEPINYGTATSGHRDFSIEITDVYTSGTTAFVEYKATYKGHVSGQLNINGGEDYSAPYTSANDDAGNVYSGYNIDIALGDVSNFTNMYKKIDIYPNNVYKGAIRIENIKADGTKFTSIILSSRFYPKSGSWIEFEFNFANVPIIR